jgi:hypothetical protein
MATKTRSSRKARRRNRSARERCSFNRREAAYFADVSVRQVNKAIEEKVLKPWRPDADRVYLEWDDVVTLALIAKTPLKLPRQTKKQIRRWVKTFEASDVSPGELALGEVLVLRADSDIASMAGRLDAYRESRERYIETDPEIQGGGTGHRRDALTGRLGGHAAGARRPARGAGRRLSRDPGGGIRGRLDLRPVPSTPGPACSTLAR